MISQNPCRPLRSGPLMTKMRPAIIAVGLSLIAGSAIAETKVAARDLSSLLSHCEAPVAALTVTAFKCKASACSVAPAPGSNTGLGALMSMAQAAQGLQTFPNIGDGLSNALTTALKTTGCFKVMAREDFEDLRREAEAAGITLKSASADYLVTGAITSLAVGAKTQSFGGGFVPLVGAVSRSTKSANISIDVRLVDVKASEVKASQTFDVSNERSSWGAGGAGWGGSGALFGAASSTQSPELDSVANESVIQAANYIVTQVAGSAAIPPVAAITK
ncbi:hypothetical protein EIB18_09010 [Caulobacter vibrioides]|uniref:Uncharacterized protein n=1 Tax=Caulobacter vibrioides (strain ATCC 19089 / CIP 103742 / CB 15) TaxID=190650 RepID=Q9A7M6_CAUVC|nr:conserved hypothetical protein [Caulobacter vibrioides CB15]ATC28576.1 hypothetical protein CA607_09375 [Caulobacter vibrioides]AZH12839.1 hypothetical protein EIB18_09010 [Caulobacter vibrioides]